MARILINAYTILLQAQCLIPYYKENSNTYELFSWYFINNIYIKQSTVYEFLNITNPQ
jgi:hypothetical protein